MFPIIQIGPIALQAPGLILLIGLWSGLLLSERLAPRFRAKPNDVYNLVFVGLIAAVLGARVSFVIQNYEVFLQNPLNVISLNPGLLDPIGGIAIGLISALVYGNRKGISWKPTLDAISPFLCVMMIAYGFSNLASGDAFGAETTLPWGIHLWGGMRHPTQVYQVLAGGLILGIIWPRTANSNTVQRIPGETIIGFLALSAGAWLFLEAFRGDSNVLSNGIRTNQIFAWLLLAVSLWVHRKLHQQES
ncbi:MAG: prolipoprotein diacylglyceryl transferase [Anaerolineales bacterium]